MQGWMKARRLLVIVRSSSSHAVFVFHSKTLPVGDESDIEVESVLPIKHDFKCVISNYMPSSFTQQTDLIKLSSPLLTDARLIPEMLFSSSWVTRISSCLKCCPDTTRKTSSLRYTGFGSPLTQELWMPSSIGLRHTNHLPQVGSLTKRRVDLYQICVYMLSPV